LTSLEDNRTVTCGSACKTPSRVDYRVAKAARPRAMKTATTDCPDSVDAAPWNGAGELVGNAVAAVTVPLVVGMTTTPVDTAETALVIVVYGVDEHEVLVVEVVVVEFTDVVLMVLAFLTELMAETTCCPRVAVVVVATRERVQVVVMVEV